MVHNHKTTNSPDDAKSSGEYLKQQMHDALLQHIPDCVFIKDTEGRYLMVNQAMARLLGHADTADVVGKTDDAFLSPEKARDNRADEKRIMSSGTPVLERSEFIQNNRLSAWYSITKAPFRDAEGNVIGLIGIGRDISEHIQNEKRERATSHDLKAIVDIADRLIGSSELDTLLRKAVDLARSHLRVERCSILLNNGTHLRGTYGTDIEGRSTDERDRIIEIDSAWQHRFRIWSRRSSQWVIERDIERSSPDARAAKAKNFWVATTPIKNSRDEVIAVFCNDAVISGNPPDERLQDVVAVFCSILGNIIEHQKSIDELSRRDKVLEAVARSTGQMLMVDDLGQAIQEGLRVLGEAMDVDRAYIYKNFMDPLTGEWYMGRQFSWTGAREYAGSEDKEFVSLPYQPVYSRMYEQLASGHIYGGPVHNLSSEEKTFLDRRRVVSILVVPIHVNNQFWGFIGFDDCRTAREWSSYEKTTLLTMAGNLGGAITKSQTQLELNARDRILSGVARANHELLTNSDLENAIASSLRILASAVNVERAYLCENLPDIVSEDIQLCPRYIFDRTTGKLSRYSGLEKHFSYSEHLPGWHRVMSSGKPIHGRLMDFIHKDSAEVRAVLFAPLMIEKKFWGIIGFDSPDPEYNWSESEVSTLSTMAGSIGGAIARKRAEDSLRMSEEHFRSLIENASDMILVVDSHGLILYGSPSVERQLGYRAALLPRINFFDMIHAEDRAVVRPIFRPDADRVASAGLREIRIRHHAGHWLHLECAIRNVPDEEGNTRFVINSRDVTQRVNAEEALRKSEELLRHSQKMEAVGRLAGGISHDFNNLLTAILGYGDLLLSQISEDNAWRREILEIKNAADKAHTLTRQLLAFSRRQVMEPRKMDLNTVVQDMERLLKRLISEDVDLVTEISSKPCPVKIDRGQIEQVIINLALNARDAMRDGGELRIKTECHTQVETLNVGMQTIPSGDYVLLKIADTGHGISDDIKPHIFEPFFTTKEVGKGTGLGLSMVYGTIEQSGGHILFESEVGKGTEFVIYLPRTDLSATAEHKVVTPGTSRGSETILLIEDDQIVRELSVRILEGQGYRVIAMQNGEEGLAYFKAHSSAIDMILTDIIMPRMSGLALVRAARQLSPGVRVLFMSGYSEDQQPELHETGEGRNYIQKPFTVATLCSRIREILDQAVVTEARPA